MRTALTLAGLAIAVAGPAVSVPASAHATAAECQGKPATIVQSEGIVTGTAGDDVIVGGATTKVLAGAGDDTVCTTGGDVDGGAGVDSVEMRSDGEYSPQLTDLEHLDVVSDNSLAGVSLTWTETPRVLTGSVVRPAAGTLDGGVVARAERVTVDLQQGFIKLGPGLALAIDGFKDAYGIGGHVRLQGDDQRNYLHLSGCNAVARGGDGNDHMWIERHKGAGDCAPARLLGQRGNDRLNGSRRGDVLIGGPGRGDTADGWSGNDLCIAEKKDDCER
jgi:Ca2+-binding RTX toxin-like protein